MNPCVLCIFRILLISNNLPAFWNTKFFWAQLPNAILNFYNYRFFINFITSYLVAIRYCNTEVTCHSAFFSFLYYIYILNPCILCIFRILLISNNLPAFWNTKFFWAQLPNAILNFYNYRFFINFITSYLVAIRYCNTEVTCHSAFFSFLYYIYILNPCILCIFRILLISNNLPAFWNTKFFWAQLPNAILNFYNYRFFINFITSYLVAIRYCNTEVTCHSAFFSFLYYIYILNIYILCISRILLISNNLPAFWNIKIFWAQIPFTILKFYSNIFCINFITSYLIAIRYCNTMVACSSTFFRFFYQIYRFRSISFWMRWVCLISSNFLSFWNCL